MPNTKYECCNCYSTYLTREEAVKCEGQHMPAKTRQEIVEGYGERIAVLLDKIWVIVHEDFPIDMMPSKFLSISRLFQPLEKEVKSTD